MPEPTLPSLDDMRRLATTKRDSRYETLTLQLTTATPVYGGGTTAGRIDPLVPFRPRAIRNGLRHWWWLLNRHRDFAGPGVSSAIERKQALYDALTGLWGGAAQKGEDCRAKVHVEVSGVSNVRTAPYVAYKVKANDRGEIQFQDNASVPWIYALFGARGQRAKRPVTPPVRHWEPHTFGDTFEECFVNDEAEKVASCDGLYAVTDGECQRPARLVLPGAKFTLTVRIDNEVTATEKSEIKQAIGFWLCFGGLGARTSRGLGRLTCDASQFDAWASVDAGCRTSPQGISSGRVLARAGTVTSPSLAPLPGQPSLATAMGTPERAILWLLEAYGNFRQARNRGVGAVPGRSQWPKPEVVRRATDMRSSSHQSLAGTFGNDWLPDLLFGAPIVVSFNCRPPRGPGDPDTPVEIVFADGEKALNRYSSPLFLSARPEHIEGRLKWRPCALYLSNRPDFKGRQLAARIKNPGPRGATLTDIPHGTWWIDFDSTYAAVDEATRTKGLGNLPNPTSAKSPVEIFLRQIQSGRYRP